MITFVDAVKIAYRKKEEFDEKDRHTILSDAFDCGSFFTITLDWLTPYGLFRPRGGKFSYDISKQDGAILDYPSYMPGTEYGDILDCATELEIPEEYRE